MGDGELMVIFGPPAVGKMTVGRAVCERTDFRLFLNHDTIEPLVRDLRLGHAALPDPQQRVPAPHRRGGRRLRHPARSSPWCGTSRASRTPGGSSALVAPYADAGLPVSFVELAADLETRLERNRGEDRLLAKPSKRDLAWSEAHLHEREETRVMNTDPAVPMAADAVLAAHRHLRLDNQGPDPEPAAEQIVAWLARN